MHTHSPLTFASTKAHSHAFEVAKLLHRDISMGNIILTDEGRGLLIDWEMAKKVDEIGRRRPDRTVCYSIILYLSCTDSDHRLD